MRNIQIKTHHVSTTTATEDALYFQTGIHANHKFVSLFKYSLSCAFVTEDTMCYRNFPCIVVAQWFPQQLDTTKNWSFMPSFELATLVMGENMMSYFEYYGPNRLDGFYKQTEKTCKAERAVTPSTYFSANWEKDSYSISLAKHDGSRHRTTAGNGAR